MVTHLPGSISPHATFRCQLLDSVTRRLHSQTGSIGFALRLTKPRQARLTCTSVHGTLWEDTRHTGTVGYNVHAAVHVKRLAHVGPETATYGSFPNGSKGAQ